MLLQPTSQGFKHAANYLGRQQAMGTGFGGMLVTLFAYAAHALQPSTTIHVPQSLGTPCSMQIFANHLSLCSFWRMWTVLTDTRIARPAFKYRLRHNYEWRMKGTHAIHSGTRSTMLPDIQHASSMVSVVQKRNSTLLQSFDVRMMGNPASPLQPVAQRMLPECAECMDVSGRYLAVASRIPQYYDKVYSLQRWDLFKPLQQGPFVTVGEIPLDKPPTSIRLSDNGQALCELTDEDNGFGRTGEAVTIWTVKMRGGAPVMLEQGEPLYPHPSHERLFVEQEEDTYDDEEHTEYITSMDVADTVVVTGATGGTLWFGEFGD